GQVRQTLAGMLPYLADRRQAAGQHLPAADDGDQQAVSAVRRRLVLQGDDVALVGAGAVDALLAGPGALVAGDLHRRPPLAVLLVPDELVDTAQGAALDAVLQ